MFRVAAIGPEAPGTREGQLGIQHLHAGVVGSDHPGLEQNILERSIKRIEQPGALCQPPAHGLARDLHPVPLKDLLLPVQGQMIGGLSHDHLRQQTRAGGALFNRLRRLGGRPHGAGAGVFPAHILDDGQLRRNIFVALAGLFADEPQILVAIDAVLFRFPQVMHDALALEMPRKRLPAAFPFLRSCPGGAGRGIVIIGAIGLGRRWGWCFGLPRLPGFREQGQLIGGELFALAVASGVQQLVQQGLDLVPLAELAVELRHQVQHHPL